MPSRSPRREGLAVVVPRAEGARMGVVLLLWLRVPKVLVHINVDGGSVVVVVPRAEGASTASAPTPNQIF